MKKHKKIYLTIIAILLILIGSGVFILNKSIDSVLNNMNHQEVIKQEEAEINPEVLEAKKKHNVINVALFGADNASSSNSSNGEERSDAMKIISLDFDTKKIKITSLERDVVVYIPGDYQKYGHLNWAYWFGGPELAVKTINYNFDLDITQYATFSMNAVRQMVDLIGGIEVELTSAEANILGNGHRAGLNTLNGYDTMSYCRIRSLDSDFVRMERQNNAINAIISKLKNQSVSELLNIVNEMMPYVTTNLTNEDIKSYLTSLLTFDLSSIETFKAPSGEYNDIQNCPGLGGYLVRSYSEMVSELHKNIYEVETYIPSKTVIENEKRTYETYGKFTKE